MSDRFVLMYHRVCERGPQTRCWFERGTAVTPAALDRQLAWLRDRFAIVALDALAEPAAPGAPPRVALTFDDGYTDTLTVAAPICARHRVTATCFACAGPAGGGPSLWFDSWYALVHASLDRPDWGRALAALGVPPAPDLAACTRGAAKQWLSGLPTERRHDTLERLAHAIGVPLPSALHLDLDGLLGLRTLGWRIGGHGIDHVRLADCAVATRDREIDGSRRLLAALGESTPLLFAYPDGDWSADVVEAVAQAGFAIACTTDRGAWTPADHRLTVPRLFCRGDAAVPHPLLGPS